MKKNQPAATVGHPYVNKGLASLSGSNRYPLNGALGTQVGGVFCGFSLLYSAPTEWHRLPLSVKLKFTSFL